MKWRHLKCSLAFHGKHFCFRFAAFEAGQLHPVQSGKSKLQCPPPPTTAVLTVINYIFSTHFHNPLSIDSDPSGTENQIVPALLFPTCAARKPCDLCT